MNQDVSTRKAPGGGFAGSGLDPFGRSRPVRDHIAELSDIDAVNFLVQPPISRSDGPNSSSIRAADRLTLTVGEMKKRAVERSGR
jgi:hypothetical protein